MWDGERRLKHQATRRKWREKGILIVTCWKHIRKKKAWKQADDVSCVQNGIAEGNRPAERRSGCCLTKMAADYAAVGSVSPLSKRNAFIKWLRLFEVKIQSVIGPKRMDRRRERRRKKKREEDLCQQSAAEKISGESNVANKANIYGSMAAAAVSHHASACSKKLLYRFLPLGMHLALTGSWRWHG